VDEDVRFGDNPFQGSKVVRPPLAAGTGDREDYAIAKYVALREAGLDNEDLRLLIVRDTKVPRGSYHSRRAPG
jgi:predicted transglutaminase-like cysteine proteinase